MSIVDSASVPAGHARKVWLLLALPAAALADPVPDQVADQGSSIPEVVITAQHLNEERSRIDTDTGASTYKFDSKAIEAQPGGSEVQLNQVMLQVPDAAQDSFGQLHIRGDHNGLQFRINGIILPDGISVFGQTLPPRLIQSMQADHGQSAGAVWSAQRGHHRPHDQKRLPGSGRRSLVVRRQSR